MSVQLNDPWSMAQVVTLLQHEFPEVTISKVRFMESQGLISPERTPSGYRHFYQADYERLHWILVQQRDSYLPLRVIRDRLNSGERLPAVVPPDIAFVDPAPEPEPELELEPEPAPRTAGATHALSGSGPGRASSRPRRERIDWAAELDPPQSADPDPVVDRWAIVDAEPVVDKPSELSNGAVSAAQPLYTRLTAIEGTQASLGLDIPEPSEQEQAPPRLPGMSLSMTAVELARSAGVKSEFVSELVRFGVIVPSSETGTPQFSNDTVDIVKLASEFGEYGLEPRHMRTILLSAEREVELYTQTVGAGLRAGNAESRRDAHRALGELSTKAAKMRAIMIKRMLRNLTP